MLLHRFKLSAILGVTSLSVTLWYLFSTSGNGMLKSSSWHDENYQKAAGNATLGFQRILVINLPSRFDRADAIVMQSVVSKIKVEFSPGVHEKELDENGLPPTSAPGALKTSEQACFRAHANVWQRMLSEDWSSVLILEADATWDVNVRAIMARVAAALNDLMDAFSPTTLKRPADSGDPYNVGKWDLFSLGQCHEKELHKNESVIYSDPDAPSGMFYYGRQLTSERVVRRSGGLTCTTAYALSRSGALKLLLRTNIDLDQPIDYVIAEMTIKGELITYSVQPSIMAQWIYEDGIGAGHKNSDIQQDNQETTDADQRIWEGARLLKDVWRLKPYHEDAGFRQGALEAIRPVLYGDGG